MTERLEEIKNVYEDYKELQKKRDFKQAEIALLYLSENYIEWLIQQAEKREYWMKQHRKRTNELEDAYFKIQLLENQLHQAQAKAERYKQALEFYADERNHEREWDTFTDSGVEKSEVMKDGGEKARQVLKGETK